MKNHVIFFLKALLKLSKFFKIISRIKDMFLIKLKALEGVPKFSCGGNLMRPSEVLLEVGVSQ